MGEGCCLQPPLGQLRGQCHYWEVASFSSSTVLKCSGFRKLSAQTAQTAHTFCPGEPPSSPLTPLEAQPPLSLALWEPTQASAASPSASLGLAQVFTLSFLRS